MVFADADLTDEKFSLRRVWERGAPLVVNGLLSKFHIQWMPEYFSTKYGTQSCLILECRTERTNGSQSPSSFPCSGGTRAGAIAGS